MLLFPLLFTNQCLWSGNIPFHHNMGPSSQRCSVSSLRNDLHRVGIMPYVVKYVNEAILHRSRKQYYIKQLTDKNIKFYLLWQTVQQKILLVYHQHQNMIYHCLNCEVPQEGVYILSDHWNTHTQRQMEKIAEMLMQLLPNGILNSHQNNQLSICDGICASNMKFFPSCKFFKSLLYIYHNVQIY